LSDLISIFLFIFIIFISYSYPKQIGWFALLVVPLLGPTTLTFAGSSLFPLTIYRVGFAVSLGLFIKHFRYKHYFTQLYKIKFVKILIIFTLFVFLISIDDRLKNMVFYFIPNHIFAVILPFVLVNNKKSLDRILVAYVWYAAIMGITVILEVFYNFNISYQISKLIPAVKEGIIDPGVQENLTNFAERGGFFRPPGLWRGSIHSSYLLSFLFPITLWYIFDKIKLLSLPIRFIPFILTSVGLIFFQTRAAYVSILISLFCIVLMFSLFSKRKLKNTLLLLSFMISLIAVTFYINQDVFYAIKSNLNYLSEASKSFGEFSIKNKVDRLWIAISIFAESPIWGHLVSRRYAYSVLMHHEDLPAPIIYMLSGGLILLFLYLSLLFKMPLDTFRMLRVKFIDQRTNRMLIFVTAAFIGGIIVLFSNFQEKHLIVMFILYISLYKVYYLKNY